jgi:phospholipid/cholesterol/gamma-HCH transport system substrate-binding protein
VEFSRGQQIKVGIFVTLGVLIMCLSIIYLGDEQVSLGGAYELRVRFKQVQGLNNGSQVSLAGLRVGNVERIEFSMDSQDLVAVLKIHREFKKRITEGAIASVKTLGALGDRYIFINPGPLDALPLAEGAWIPSDDTGDLLDVIAKRGPELANIVDVVNELNQLLKNINEDNRSRILMENLIAAAHQLKSFAAEARGSMDQQKLRDAINRMASVMTKIDQGQGTLGALINDPTLHQKLMSLLGESPRRQFLKPLIRENIRSQEQKK